MKEIATNCKLLPQPMIRTVFDLFQLKCSFYKKDLQFVEENKNEMKALTYY